MLVGGDEDDRCLIRLSEGNPGGSVVRILKDCVAVIQDLVFVYGTV